LSNNLQVTNELFAKIITVHELFAKDCQSCSPSSDESVRNAYVHVYALKTLCNVHTAHVAFFHITCLCMRVKAKVEAEAAEPGCLTLDT
jgi:hypothetical protein